MKLSKTAVIILALGVFLSCPSANQAQETRTPVKQPLITSARVAKSGDEFHGPVYATIDGKERKIADDGLETYIIQGGRQVVYVGLDGSGGFENEGQSLHIYDARTGKQRKIMSEYSAVDKVTEVTTSRKKTALIVDMVDGGRGASYLAIVDPARGQVFFRPWARVESRKGDIITINLYKDEEWDKVADNPKAKITPYKRERYNLNAILKRRVIFNKPQGMGSVSEARPGILRRAARLGWCGLGGPAAREPIQ